MDHGVLLRRMKLLNIKGNIAMWIKDFLEDRVQKDIVEGNASETSKVISGVPQDTIFDSHHPKISNIHLIVILKANSSAQCFIGDQFTFH